jgi:peptidyl-tRNA hydrolase, PTH1 family
MKFIVGIGNPGSKYDGTRHNIGFAVLDELKGKVAAKDVFLIKPKTFVNRTGDEVARIAGGHGAKPSDFLVVCDDVNLAFGKMRLRGSGSAGGHHGLESVIEALGSGDFARLRIGVGGDGMPKDLTGYVLETFSAKERKELDKILEDAVAVCREWTEKGLKAAMDRLSRLRSNQQESQNE